MSEPAAGKYPRMGKSTIVLAYANIDDLNTGRSDLLQESELRRAEQFKLAQRAQEYLGGRVLLRTLLKHFAGDTRAPFSIDATDNGKPLCPGGPAISIAHSGNIVVCAATDHGELGIDVETPQRRRDSKKIANRFFCVEESKWIDENPDERFLMMWVLKEAWLKALGTGIAGGLDSLQCTISGPEISALARDGQRANLSLYRIQSAFVGLATTAATHGSVRSYRWDKEIDKLAEGSELKRISATGTDLPG